MSKDKIISWAPIIITVLGVLINLSLLWGGFRVRLDHATADLATLEKAQKDQAVQVAGLWRAVDSGRERDRLSEKKVDELRQDIKALSDEIRLLRLSLERK